MSPLCGPIYVKLNISNAQHSLRTCSAVVVTENYFCFLSILSVRRKNPGTLLLWCVGGFYQGLLGNFRLTLLLVLWQCGTICILYARVVEYLKVYRYQTDTSTPAIIRMNTIALLSDISASNNQGPK